MRSVAAYSRVLCFRLDAEGVTYRLERAFPTHRPLLGAARDLRSALLRLPYREHRGWELAALAERIEAAIVAFLTTVSDMPGIRGVEIEALRSYLPGLAEAHRLYGRVPRKGTKNL